MAILAAKLTPVFPVNSNNKNSSGKKVDAKAQIEFGPSAATGRRHLFVTTITAASAFVAADSQTQLLDKYLKKSQENKEKNDKERMDSYYKRNYKDYFELLQGGLRQKDEKDLSESEKGILEWLDKNK